MFKRIIPVMVITVSLMATSCVSKKKYVELQENYDTTVSTLAKTQAEKEEVEAKYAAVEARVASYNTKINSLIEENGKKYDLVKNVGIMNAETKAKLAKTLAKVDPQELAGAKTLKDSMNLAISYNLKDGLSTESYSDDDIEVNIDETVVMINISDKLLFKSGSYRLSKDANGLLERLAEVINSEPAIEVMVEGHTDDRTVKPGSYIKDNWDLSTERATAIIRKLQTKYGVDPSKMIAAGRASYSPLVENDSKENMAMNRRTRIIILPNLDKFLAMAGSN